MWTSQSLSVIPDAFLNAVWKFVPMVISLLDFGLFVVSRISTTRCARIHSILVGSNSFRIIIKKRANIDYENISRKSHQ